jgi:hypothetical protein
MEIEMIETRTLIAAALGATVLGAGSSALADWHLSRWGMSPEQVIGAYSGAVSSFEGQQYAGAPGRIRAKGRIISGEIALDVSFGFGTAGLNEVYVSPANQADCWKVTRELNNKYGAPVRSAGTGTNYATAAWRSAADNLTADITSAGSSCNVVYRPLQPTNSSAL